VSTCPCVSLLVFAGVWWSCGAAGLTDMPCLQWCQIQFDAVNDTLILESWIYFILKQFFGGEPSYVPLFELYHEVCG